MRRTLALTLMIGGVAAAGMAVAQAPADSSSPTPWLSAAELPDMIKVLPPAPTDGSPRDLADGVIFRKTRALKGSPRWAMARHDADADPASMLKDFSCAVGIDLDPVVAPKLTQLLTTLALEVPPAVDPAKTYYDRKRPYRVQAGDVCLADLESLADSPDYPSGDAAFSWAVGEILAELEPARATQILVRARAFGEGRAVCGVHNASAVEGGRLAGAVLVAALQGSDAFRADLAAARAELQSLAGTRPPNPEACKAEFAVTADAPW